MVLKLKLENNIKKYYLYSFFSAIQFYGPMFLLFFQSFGFSMTQILFFLTVYSIAVLIFEIPSGILTDYIGRKKTLILFGILIFLTFLTITLGSSYAYFLLAYFLMGIARSLESGSETSLIYETLLNLRKEKEFKKVLGKGFFYGTMAVVVSFLFGGFLFSINSRLPYLVTTLFMLPIIPIVISMKEPERKKSRLHIHQHAILSIKTFIKNPIILPLALFSAFVTTAYVLNYFVNQKYLKVIGASAESIGIILAIGILIAGFAARFAHRAEARLNEKGSMILMVVMLALGYFLMSQFSFFISFIFIYLITFVDGISRPILSNYINKHLSSDKRATLLSLTSFVRNLSFAIFAPLLGILSDNFGLQKAFFIMAIAIILIGSVLVKLVMNGIRRKI